MGNNGLQLSVTIMQQLSVCNLQFSSVGSDLRPCKHNYRVYYATVQSSHPLCSAVKPGLHPNAIACVACVAFGWKPGLIQSVLTPLLSELVLGTHCILGRTVH